MTATETFYEGHTCHNPNCRGPLPMNLVAHQKAWYALPKLLRDGIWVNYRKGQEVDKRPTAAYLAVLEECIKYWREHGTKCG